MLAVDRDRLVAVALAVDDVVPPDVATVHHRRAALERVADSADDERVGHARGQGQGVVDGRLEGGGLAAAPATVGRDDEVRLGVVDAVAQGLGAEPAEDDRVGRADPGTGQHRDRQFGDHRHVDRHAIAGRHPQFQEGVRGLADLALEVGEGDRPGVAGLADPVVGDLVAQAAARRGDRRSCRRC